MKNLLLILACAVLLSGCAEERKFIKNPAGGPDVLLCQATAYQPFRSLPYQGYRSQQLDRVAFPGFLAVESEGKIIVETVIGGQNLQQELRREDQVIAVGSKIISSKKQFLDLTRGQRFDDVAFLTFRRPMGEFTLAIRMSQMFMSKMYSNLEKKLIDGRKVSVAIFPNANTTTTNASINISALIANDKEYISSTYEKMFIEEFASYQNFAVTDRNVIQKIIDEQKFQLSGIVDETTVQQLGKITGASHLFFVSMNRYEDSTNFVERLIEVETAKVVYSDNYTYVKPKPIKPKDKKDKDHEKDKEDKIEEKKEDKQPIIININNSNVNNNTNTNTNTNTNNNNNTNTNTNTNTNK